MTGLYLVTHEEIGQALVKACQATFHELPLPTVCLNVYPEDDFEQLLSQGEKQLAKFGSDETVLFLTDIYGATPSNLAHQLANSNYPVLTGLNLPMLFRLYNYPHLASRDLIKKALQGGQAGIMAQTQFKETSA